MGLDSVEILMVLEEEFAIEIAKRDVASVETAGDLYLAVLKTLRAQEPLERTEDEVWLTVRAAIASVIGCPVESVVKSARLIVDLGMD